MDIVDIIYNILAALTLLALLIYLVLPIFQKNGVNSHFFTSGRRKDSSAQQLQYRVVLESIRDLQIEQELGKLTDAEFQQHLEPLKQRLAELKQTPADDAHKKHRLQFNRLGWYCPECGNLNHATQPTGNAKLHCIQCGGLFS